MIEQGGFHESPDSPPVWVRHVQTTMQIADDKSWAMIREQALARLEEMRKDVIRQHRQARALMVLQVEIKP